MQPNINAKHTAKKKQSAHYWNINSQEFFIFIISFENIVVSVNIVVTYIYAIPSLVFVSSLYIYLHSIK